MSQELFRRLPGIDAWLESEQGRALAAEYSRDEVVTVMRLHLRQLRSELRSGRTELPAFDSDHYTNQLRADLLARRVSTLKAVINATGIVIHTNLGRAPLAEEAIAAIAAVAGYSNLEFELEDGRRGSRGRHVESLLCELTGAEGALVVNNCAAAVLLALRGLADGGDVIVSRGELIEIGGAFRMPDVIAQSGARMVEVGTTNRTRLRDYAGAIGESARVLLTSHPSNYRVVGFTERPAPEQLAELARERGLVFVHDLGSGALVDPAAAGMQAEPTVHACLAEGPDIVTFSGDKMLGGPQAGILLGRIDLIERLRRHPYARAMRIDKLSLAALEATLRLYRAPNDPWQRVPVLRMISLPVTEIDRRCREVVAALESAHGIELAVADDVSFAGGGALPMSELPTRVIELTSPSATAAELAARLRARPLPVVARVSRERVLLDLRTVPPASDGALVDALRALAS